MARRYSFVDVNSSEKPRIVTKARTFGEHTYVYECKGRSSVGYGYTPEHAYRQWKKNWQRRFNFYGQREQRTQQTLAFFERRVH